MDHPDQHTHPVLTCARVMSRAVQACDQVEAVFMTGPDKQTALLELTRVIDQGHRAACRGAGRGR